MPLLAIVVAGVVGLSALIGTRQPEIKQIALQSPPVEGAIFHPTFGSEFESKVKAPVTADSLQSVYADEETPAVWK